MGCEERVPHMRQDVSFPLRAVEVVRGAPDGDGFLYSAHPPICYLLDLLSIVPVKSVILGGSTLCYC